MKHVADEQFWDCYNRLPLAVQKSVDNNFTVIKQYPNHPLLRLMRIDDVISMRVGSRCRALGIEENGTTIWFWVGSFQQYASLVQ
ncbi:MAG: hypothetical protein PHP42_11305 [Bacteroidota bacterium]|nr:hypothetical protein [Bacteroidota bacterium]